MQHDSCENIQLLISRLVDDEVSPSERERVEQHVATCDACAYKMLEFMEMAVLFSETPLRAPEPQLRASLYREIGNIKEEARLKDEANRIAREKPWYMPAPPPTQRKGGLASTFLGRFFQAVSPLAVAATALFVFLGALLVGNKLFPDTATDQPTREVRPPPGLPTLQAPVAISSNPGVAPPPVKTEVELASASPAAHPSYVIATATLGGDSMAQLIQPTPILEEGNASDKATWHTMQDEEYGYRIDYPPNWWTSVAGDVRYFYPWTAGGTEDAPYWVEMHVSSNPAHYTAKNGNADICGGACAPWPSGSDPVWLRRTAVDSVANESYDEAYLFDSTHIYQLRVTVPIDKVPGAPSFQERQQEAQNVFTTMSGRLMLASQQSQGGSTFGGVLFLNGADLWLASEATGNGATKVTRGYKVRQFAQSPDLGSVAFTGSEDSGVTPSGSESDPWARAVYLTVISPNGPVAPTLLLSDMDVHDIAWYSDHDLLVLAQPATGPLTIYKITLPTSKATSDAVAHVQQIVALPAELSGAGSLAVSPDRQLITFLAPVGEKQDSDVYAVRPDGTNLIKLVSHSDAVSLVGNNVVLTQDSQAIKSYAWAGGHLEPNGYQADLLFICGNSYGPHSFPGGFLYSTESTTHNPLADPMSLISEQPERLQIVQVAYAQGKVAFAGYETDVNPVRADQIMGLWTGDYSQGKLVNVHAQPLPQAPDGVTDLQWSADGQSLIYRETIPASENTYSMRYDGGADFRMVGLDVATGDSSVLYDGERP